MASSKKTTQPETTEASAEDTPLPPARASLPEPSPETVPEPLAAKPGRAPLEKAPPAPPAPAPEPPAAPKATYRVWEHGTLQRDGTTYQPGEEIVLDAETAAAIPCLVKVR